MPVKPGGTAEAKGFRPWDESLSVWSNERRESERGLQSPSSRLHE